MAQFALGSSALHYSDRPSSRRTCFPELLPKFVSLLADAERTGEYKMVRKQKHVGGFLWLAPLHVPPYVYHPPISRAPLSTGDSRRTCLETPTITPPHAHTSVQVIPALTCLEALGSAVEEYLHLLLPALVR